MNQDFLFQLGDIVLLKTAIADCETAARHGELRSPLSGIIVERWTQECPGGVQRLYSIGMGDLYHRVNEIEIYGLASAYDATGENFEAFIAARLRLREPKREEWGGLSGVRGGPQP